MFITKIMIALVLCHSAFAEKPFMDLSYQEAVTEAKTSNKLIMIDFYTTWCGPCKMLDKTTWKDEKVQKWLEENTVALKVNAEKLRSVAKKFNVSAYPAIVFIDEDELFSQGRFEEYIKVENLDRVIMIMEMDKDRDFSEGTKDIIVQIQVDRALQPFEALLVTNRDKDASRLMNTILAIDSSPNTIEKLRKVAAKRDRTAYIETINNVATSQTVDATDE